MIDVFELLKKSEGVSDYKVISSEVSSYQLFYVKKKIETARATDVNEKFVTVYVDHDGFKGESSFSVFEGNTEAEVKDKIEKATARAKLVSNQNYDIVGGGKGSYTVKSNFEGKELKSVAEEIAKAVFKADNYKNGSINATEIFVYKKTVNVKNSKGVDKTQVKYRAMVEAIPTWNEGESVELYENYEFTELIPEEITAEIDGKMREVRDRRNAEKPTEKIKCKVVLGAHEIQELLRNYVSDLDFASVYSKSNLFKKNGKIQTAPKGDKLTLTMKAQIKGSVFSSAFDDDGYSLADKTIIKDGKVVANHGTVRFAEYLKEQPTGMLSCMKLDTGTLTEKELKKEPYFECVSLSGIQVDLYNDYIGGEIRLAYYYDGKQTRSITGVSMSGRLSKVLNTVRLNKIKTIRGSYEGPSKMVLDGMNIV